MAEEAGEENFFLFGLTAEQVQNSRGWYSPRWHYENEPETRAALDLIFNDHFSRDEPGIFAPIRETLLERGDYYMHLADLTSYAQAQSESATVRRSGRLGPQGDHQRGLLRQVLQRPHDRRICRGNLERDALSRGLMIPWLNRPIACLPRTTLPGSSTWRLTSSLARPNFFCSRPSN